MKRIAVAVVVVLALLAVSPAVTTPAQAVPVDCEDGFWSVDCWYAIVVDWFMNGPWGPGWDWG